ncbi:MAG: hypothetical protein AB8B91_24250 [Rubripirellula sp.]
MPEDPNREPSFSGDPSQLNADSRGMDEAAFEAFALEALLTDDARDSVVVEPPKQIAPSNAFGTTIKTKDVIESVKSTVETLQEMVGEIAPRHPDPQGSEADDSSQTHSAMGHHRLLNRICDLENQISELQQQNADLAAQVANANVRDTVSTSNSGCNDSLSWEERKALIFQQMEEDTYDADAFVESLRDSADSEPETPQQFIERLNEELEQRNADLEKRDQEIRELHHLLDQQSETRTGGVAIGAAAIAELIDSDDLVREERQRLQLLQAEWEEKFRQQEIQASLERARLSRERQTLAKKQSEAEDRLADLERQLRQPVTAEGQRRWMAALGLNE